MKYLNSIFIFVTYIYLFSLQFYSMSYAQEFAPNSEEIANVSKFITFAPGIRIINVSTILRDKTGEYAVDYRDGTKIYNPFTETSHFWTNVIEVDENILLTSSRFDNEGFVSFNLFFYVIGKGSMTICSTSWSMSDSNYSTPHTIYLYPIIFVNNILTFIIDHVSDINSVSRTHQIVQITGDWRTIGINIPYLTGDNNTGENVPQNGLPGLRIIDNRFIVAYICDLEINDLISHSPVMLGGKNDDILLIDANNSDTPLSQIKWCSKYLTIVIMETNYGGSDSPMIYIKALLPASSNSFYVILDVVPNHYKLYKVTGPFEPAASVPDFTVHN